MTNNDILRRVRYALDIKDSAMVKIFSLAEHEIDVKTVLNLLRKEEDENYLECSDEILSKFLDGLIVLKRGPRNNSQAAPAPEAVSLDNNEILKKLRIALELKVEDIIDIMKLANFRASKSEIGALFRKKGHKNYKACLNQFLRNFLLGLAKRYRAPKKLS